MNAVESRTNLLYIKARPGIFGRVSLSKDDYEKLYKTAETAVIMRQMASREKSTSEEMAIELDRRDRRLREMAEETQRTRAQQRNQEEELGILRTLLRLITDLFKNEPAIYETYRQYRRNDDGASFGRMNWKIQCMIDEACGTSYADEDRSRYLAMKKQREQGDSR